MLIWTLLIVSTVYASSADIESDSLNEQPGEPAVAHVAVGAWTLSDKVALASKCLHTILDDPFSVSNDEYDVEPSRIDVAKVVRAGSALKSAVLDAVTDGSVLTESDIRNIYFTRLASVGDLANPKLYALWNDQIGSIILEVEKTLSDFYLKKELFILWNQQRNVQLTLSESESIRMLILSSIPPIETVEKIHSPTIKGAAIMYNKLADTCLDSLYLIAASEHSSRKAIVAGAKCRSFLQPALESGKTVEYWLLVAELIQRNAINPIEAIATGIQMQIDDIQFHLKH